MKVGKYCNHNIVVGEVSDSLLNAARLMHGQNTVYLVVIEKIGNFIKPIGILTCRDILNQCIIENIDPATINLADIIISEPVLAREDDGVDITVTRMSEMDLRCIPVVNNLGQLIGIFTIDDLIKVFLDEKDQRKLLADRTKEAGQNPHSMAGNHTV